MPEWVLMVGLGSGGLVYEHVSRARAYVHVDDDGDLDVVTWDPGDDRAFPDREALETIIGDDLRRMRESDNEADRALLLLAGIGPLVTIKSSRGRRKRWDVHTLERFVDDVVDGGMPIAMETWKLSRRQALEVMHMAERAGLAVIKKSGGKRSANIYARADAPPRRRASAMERAEWHRRRLYELERKRSELRRNWERQQTNSTSGDGPKT